jgi:DNA-directed RNA polymerase specialized sigma24 family protein
MKKNNRFQSAAAIVPQGAAPERLSPIVHHLLDGVARRALEGDRAAIAELARRFRGEMVEHAHAHLRRFDCDAEDVVQDVFVEMLEGALPQAPESESAVVWLLGIVAVRAGRRH